MKKILSTLFLVCLLNSGMAAATINPANKYSYGANLGWLDWLGDTF